MRKKVEIQIVATFDQLHEKIITQFPGKNCLILANEEALLRLWQHFYQASDHPIQLQA
ncbi:MAG: hypothetical protein Q4B28_07360 [bacterium]|nr:hypothetical protein [bacterium]